LCLNCVLKSLTLKFAFPLYKDRVVPLAMLVIRFASAYSPDLKNSFRLAKGDFFLFSPNFPNLVAFLR